MRFIKIAFMISMAAVLSSCFVTAPDSLRRNCSIGLINVPVHELADLKVTAGLFEMQLDDLKYAGQSTGQNESTYEWWPEMDAPGSIRFELEFKDGSQVIREGVISRTSYNRVGINGVYIVCQTGGYTVEPRYGIVSEYDKRYRDAINTWFFSEDGSLKNFSHSKYGRNMYIRLTYTNSEGAICLTEASHFRGQEQPYVTLFYDTDGAMNEVTVLQQDKPERVKIYYSPAGTIRKVTRKKSVPGSRTVDEDVTNQPALYSGCVFPDLSFVDRIAFDPQKALAERKVRLIKGRDGESHLNDLPKAEHVDSTVTLPR